MKDAYTLILFLFLVSGCTKSAKSPREYAKYVSDPSNGLVRSRHMDKIDYTLVYKPYPLIALIENGSRLDSTACNKTLREIEGLQYFNLKLEVDDRTKDILKANIVNVQDYYARIEYFSFAMQNDVWLIDGNDSLPCRLFHYERNFNAAPHTDFSLAFDDLDKNKENDKTIVFNDRVFNNGLIRFTVKASDIKKIPDLKI